jgi:hypothetical protein
VRATLSALAVLCGGLPLSAALAAGLVGSSASAARAAPLAAATAARLTAADAGGSLQSCVAYAYAAIERHQVIPATPAACRGLSRAEVNQAAGIAIRMTVTSGAKAARREQAVAAARWAQAMIAAPAPVPSPVASAATLRPSADGRAGPSESAGGLGLGGVSEFAAKIGALLAWLATAASGGFVLVRWLLAGGSPLRRTLTSAPPAVILSHVGAGALGLVLWVSFMLSGWVPLAWTALAILAPVAGLGMGVLLLGLPGPVRPPTGTQGTGTQGTGTRGTIPVLAIAGHGVFAATALLLVLMATIGAG